MVNRLKEKTISGMLWTAVERFGASLFLFISNLVLARLLKPEDFGVIAMLMVFISISDAIVDAGFGSALIQKQDVHQRDYSTVFVWNIFFSLILYGILFISAPAIAKFYNICMLKDVLRIQSIVIPLNALIYVHIASLKKKLRFKKIAKINLLGIIVGTIVGIVAAFYGAGVWSLVLKLLLTAIIQVVCYYISNDYIPSFVFDFQRFKSMFAFGGFIFLNRIINTLFHNILALIIGKGFSASALGYYNQARKLEDIPRNSLSSICTTVAFPVFSQINNDTARLHIAAKKCMRNMAFISIPMMICAVIIAKPLILLLFTEKWIATIPYFQVLCFGGLVLTFLELNTVLLNSMGRSKLSFYIRFVQRVLEFCLLLIGVQFGMEGLLVAYVAGEYLCFIISGVYSGKYANYGLLQQIEDLLPFLFISIIAAWACCCLYRLLNIEGNLSLVFVQIILFFSFYIGVSKLLKLNELDVCVNSVKRFVKIKDNGR